MNRTQHPSNNFVLGAPPGWDQSTLPCDALPVTRCELEGMPAMLSFWRPTAEELQALAAGGLVILSVLGCAHPPVSVGVTSL